MCAPWGLFHFVCKKMTRETGLTKRFNNLDGCRLDNVVKQFSVKQQTKEGRE